MLQISLSYNSTVLSVFKSVHTGLSCIKLNQAKLTFFKSQVRSCGLTEYVISNQQGFSLFRKIRDTKGTFHAQMSTIKDRNSMDLTEAEDIKRW